MLEHLLVLRTSADARRELKVSEQIQRLLLFAADCQSQGEREKIPDAIRYLQSYLEHHFEQKITLDDMAQFCGLSKYHLCREFKRYTSFSPKEYLLQLRIARAKMLLLGSEAARLQDRGSGGHSRRDKFYQTVSPAGGNDAGGVPEDKTLTEKALGIRIYKRTEMV